MTVQSLEELKKEVQEAEEIQEEVEDVEDVDLEEEDQEDVEDVDAEESEEDPGEEEPESKPEDVEPWLQTDDMEPVPAKTHLKMKSKWKGRLSDAEDESNALKSELDQVKRELESLKTGTVVTNPVPGSKIVRPRRSDFDIDDDDGFNDAYDRYLDEAERERQQRYQIEANQTSKVKKAQAEVAQAVEDHYDRASKLSEKHNIDPENFKKADFNFRSAIESIAPGNGDSFADRFITILGEGSEKVLYHIGVNEAARGKFLSALASDPSGLKATAFLGQKKAELTKTQSKTTSRAPKPATRHNGDSKGVSATARKLKKQYAKFVENPQTLQKAQDLRTKAKKLKIDVSDW